MASRLQEFKEFTEELLKANRRAYHDHDNLLPSHPVRVKDHPNWFSRVEDLSNEQKIQQTINGDINLYKTLSVLSKHGTPYLVGGSVRDIILGKESKDYDIEVYGISSEKLGQILEAELGAKPQQVGKQFGVFKFGDFDISLPRKEVKTGERHTDFDIEFDENLEPRDGARRRDFTVNALMYNPKTGKIYDFFGGLDDLKNKQLKHIDDKTFVEDALRVYRAAQFAGRFGFTIHPATKQLASSIDLSHLPPERLYEEFKKLFLKSPKPSVGIRALDDMGVLDKYFPEVAALKTTDQRSDYHAEGDVYIHTNMVIDKAAEIIKNFRSEQDQKTIMLAAFAHDFGKPITTEHSSDGLITQHGHEEAGVEPTKVFLSKLTTETDTIADVSFLVEHHLLPMNSHRNNLSDAGFRKMINKYGIDRLKLLSAVSRADVTGRLHTNDDGTIGEPGTEEIDWFEGKIKEISGNLGTTAEGKITPLITGNDLIGAGFKEGPDLGKVLGAVRSQQEDGSLTNKAEAMKFVSENFVAKSSLEQFKELLKAITPEGVQAMANGLVPQTGNPEAPGKWILPSERDKANERDQARGSTARPWAKTTVGTWVLDNVDKDTKILDYGAGKGFQTRRLQGIEEYAPGGIHAEHAPDKPFTDVHAYDAYSPPKAEHSYNDASLLDNKYGVVMVSNVLNVQETDQDLHDTLNELASLIDDDGKIVVNFPESPRKNKESMPAEGKAQQREWFTNIISEHFNSVESIQTNHWELSKPKTKSIEKQEGGVGGAAYAGGTVMGTEQSTPTFGRVDSKKKPKNELFDILSKVTKKSDANLETLEVMIGKKSFNLEMTTDQVKGLGGRTSLETGHGMIFPFRAWYPAKMTMNDMQFPLDFIIVGEDDRIIQIEQNVQPAEDVILTFPPCKMIIEINAGEADNILLNDTVSGVSFFQNYLVKSGGEAPGASEARASGLVPQTGNWQFPGRYVSPEHADDANGNPVPQTEEDQTEKQKQGIKNFTDKIQQSIDFDEEGDIASSEIKNIDQKIVSLLERQQRLNALTDEKEIEKVSKGIDNLRDKKRSLAFIKNQTEELARTIESNNKRKIAKYEFKFDETGRLASFAKVSDSGGTFHIDAAVTIASKYRKENSSSGVQVMMDVLHRFLTESKSETIACQPLDEHVERFYKKFGFIPFEVYEPSSDDPEDWEAYDEDLDREGELALSKDEAFDLYNRYSKHFNMSPIVQKEHSGAMEEIRELIELESKFGILIGGKLEKEEVQYRDATKIEKDNSIMCGTCKYFNAEISTCDLVKGTIMPSDWCSIFAPIEDSSIVEKQEAPGAQDARKEGLVPQSGRWDKPERWVRPEESDEDDPKVKEDREITSKKKFFGKIAGSYDVDTELQALEDYKDTLPELFADDDDDVEDDPKKRAINKKISEEWDGIDFIETVFKELNDKVVIINSESSSTNPNVRRIHREKTTSANVMEQYEFKFGEAGELEAFARVDDGSKVFSIDTVVTMPSKYKKQGSSAGTKLMMDLMHRFLTESKTDLIATTPLNEHVGKYYKKFGFTETNPGILSTLSMDRESAKVAYNKFSKRFKMDLVKQEQQEVDHDDLLDDLKELIALEEEVGVLSRTMKKKEEKIEKAEEWSDYHLKDVEKQMLAPDHRLSYETGYPPKTGYKSEADFIRELSEAGKFDPKLLTEELSEEQDMNLKEELDTIYKQEQETVTPSGCSLCEEDCDCVMVTDLSCKCDHDCICSDLEFGKMIMGGY